MKKKTLYLANYLENLQKKGVYTFTRKQAIEENNLTAISFQKSVRRLLSKKKVVRFLKEFFVIVPVEYQNVGAPPISWFIDDLMQYLKHPYYVAMLSAASLHGAAHQQPQEFQVMSDITIRPIRTGNSRIKFFYKKSLEKAVTQQIKTPTGYIDVSTPEFTALDLVRYFKGAGYLSHVATVLSELCLKINARSLLRAAKNYSNHASIQRLGFLLEYVSENKNLTKLLYIWIKRQNPRFVPLLPGKEIDNSNKDYRWNLYLNEVVEIDE